MKEEEDLNVWPCHGGARTPGREAGVGRAVEPNRSIRRGARALFGTAPLTPARAQGEATTFPPVLEMRRERLRGWDSRLGLPPRTPYLQPSTPKPDRREGTVQGLASPSCEMGVTTIPSQRDWRRP